MNEIWKEYKLNFNRKYYGSITKLPNEIILNAYLEVKMRWLGIAESAKKYGMPRTTLSSIMNKRSRRDVTDNCDLILEIAINDIHHLHLLSIP